MTFRFRAGSPALVLLLGTLTASALEGALAAPLAAEAAPAMAVPARPVRPKSFPQGILFPYDYLDRALYQRSDSNGNVDYAALKDEPYLDMFVDAVTTADLSRFPVFPAKDKAGKTVDDHSAELVFWINAYNALMLKTIAAAYPVDTPDQIPNLDTAVTHTVAGKAYSFQQLRTKIAEMDPRALFALTDGTRSGPLLASSAYRYADIQDRLALVTQSFVNDGRNVTVDRPRNLVTVNPWFAMWDTAFKPPTSRRKWDGIRYILSAYTTQRAYKDYLNTGDYQVQFARSDRMINNKVLKNGAEAAAMQTSLRRAKIICTIGPASRSTAMMRSLLLNGMDVARFNFSHGGPQLQAEHIARLREVSEELRQPVAILQDLQGPKIRTGPIQCGVVDLVPGQTFTLTTRGVPGDETCVSTTYQALPRDCRRGDMLLLDDGKIALQVESVTATDVVCTVADGGELKPNKGINLPGVAVSAPSLSEKDRHDVEWGLANGVDYVALSFVRRPADVRELKQLVAERQAHTQIIAKLEKPEAIDDLAEIIAEADGVMVARGDLGVEMPPEEVPLLQKQIIQQANRAGKIVITATQMLESMTTTQRPTRAEASDVANAVLDGTDALMLSGETASGAYPLESVQMMVRIVRRVEDQTDDGWHGARLGRHELGDFTTAICEAAAHAAAGLNARAIACYTETGGTAYRLAKFRPPVPIVACTPNPHVVRQLQLAWGVRPLLIGRTTDTDELIRLGDQALMSSGLVAPRDPVVVTLGAPVALRGSTNLMMLHRVGEGDMR